MGKVQKINGPSLFLRIIKDILISSDGLKLLRHIYQVPT
jgi:hypothetical protein